MIILSAWTEIGDAFSELVNKIGIQIVAGIFEFASGVFEIFLILADGSLMSSINIDNIISNFYLILGIIMLFFVAFAMLKGMVNPDDSKQGTSVIRKVVLNLITSAFIMAVLPSIFTFAYDFQKSFIYDYNPIGKFFGYGGDNVSSDSDVIKKGANKITNGMFTALFNADQSACGDGMNLSECQETINNGDINLRDAITQVDSDGNFSLYATFADKVPSQIKFNFIISLIAGFIVIYVAVSFCFDMATRFAKLMFFQIIAPIPLFLRVIPDGKISGIFNDWVKKTFSCYFEVYLRIFVFYFGLYLCDLLMKSNYFENINGSNWLISLFAKAIALMGLIIFMKQVPKLIGEMTGINSGNMKLGIRDKLKEGLSPITATAAGLGSMAAAGITRGKGAAANVKNKWQSTQGKTKLGTGLKRAGLVAGAALSTAYTAGKGAVTGTKQGWKDGNLKSIGSEVKNARTLNDAESEGMTFKENATNIVREKFGFDTTADASARKINAATRNIINNSGNTIKYTDRNGIEHEILAGQSVAVNSQVIEDFEAEQKKIIGEQSAFNEQKRRLNNKVQTAQKYSKGKATLESEANSKIDAGEVTHRIHLNVPAQYEEVEVESSILGADGKPIMKKEKRLVREAQEIDFTGDIKAIEHYINNEVDADLRHNFNMKKIREEMQEEFIRNAYDSDKPNRIKTDTVSYFESMINAGGYEFQTKDKDGKIITQKMEIVRDAEGVYSATIDGKVFGTVDADGNVKKHTNFDLMKELKNIGINDANIKALEMQHIDEREIQPRQARIEDLKGITKEFNERKESELQSESQRRKEIAKKHRANRGGK